MKKKLYFETLLCLSLAGILPSIVATLLFIIVPDWQGDLKIAWIVTIIANIVILAATIFFLFDFRVFQNYKSRYYKYNLPAILTYALIGIGASAMIEHLQAVHFISRSGLAYKIHTMFFYNFKSLHMFSYSEETGYLFSLTASAAIYAVFYLLVVAVFPLCFNKRRYLGLEEDKNSK